jgi:hypothetical protein
MMPTVAYQGKHALGPEEKLIFKSATLSLGDLLGLSLRWTDQSDWCAYSACTALDRADVVAVTPDGECASLSPAETLLKTYHQYMRTNITYHNIT